MRLPEAAFRLLSGATAMPKRASQRCRARMMLRKRTILATTGGGGLPASTCSKWRRASVSSSSMKKERAEFETHPHKLRVVHQDGTERRNGLVELLVPRFPIRDGVCGPQRRHAGTKQCAGAPFRTLGGRHWRNQRQHAQKGDADGEGFHGP